MDETPIFVLVNWAIVDKIGVVSMIGGITTVCTTFDLRVTDFGPFSPTLDR